jgi:hypothetical protein
MSQASKPPRENLLLSLALNVIVPSVLLSKGKDWFGLAPTPMLLIALAFPLGYGIYDALRRRRWSLFSTIGLVSTAVTGGVGLLNLPKGLIIAEKAAVPAIFGIAVLASMFTRKSLVGALLYSPEIFDVERIGQALASRGTQAGFDSLLRRCTLILAASFFVSAVANYIVASWMITAEPGTDAFNEQLGKFSGLGHAIVFVPFFGMTVLALMQLLKGIKTHSGLEWEDVMHGAPPKETPAATGPTA